MTDRDAERVEFLPIFPLASVVLFPQVRVPLYIFEPRYRQMTEAALGASGRIGMVTVVPEQVELIGHDPEIFPIGCAGQIESSRKREDGTFDILLEGVFRFRIERELERPEGQLYREAQVAVLRDDEPESTGHEIERLRTEVHQRYGALLERIAPQHVEHFRSMGFDLMPHAVYANTISVSLNIDAVEKQSLLESSSTLIRLERLLTVLEFELAEPLTRGPSNPVSVQ
jgi:Lon protease-like protein